MEKIQTPKTTIQIDKSTLEILRGLKITNRESYNEIILRLVKNDRERN